MKKQVATHFGRAASTYAGAADVQREVARACADKVPRGHYGLAVEIGTGGGLLTDMLRERVGIGAYVGLDISRAMLAGAAAEGSLLVQADGEAAPLPPGRAGLLASASTMQWYRDPARSIPENLALLAPGGVFSLAVFVEGTLAELARVSAETGFGSVLPMRPAAAYVDAVRAAGVEFQSRGLRVVRRYATPRDALRQLQRTGATCTGAKRAYAPSRFKAFSQRYEALYGGADGVAATYEAVLLWGYRPV